MPFDAVHLSQTPRHTHLFNLSQTIVLTGCSAALQLNDGVTASEEQSVHFISNPHHHLTP